jgi:hypothetical protein
LSPLASGGNACAPRNVVFTMRGRISPTRRAARSDFISVAVSSPYPDLISRVVTPSATSASTRGSALATSSSSLAARVAFMVETIPPPARAISS